MKNVNFLKVSELKTANCPKNGLLAEHFPRDINFEDTRSAKSAILTHLEALNFDFHGFLHFLMADIYQMDKIHTHRSLIWQNTAVFEL